MNIFTLVLIMFGAINFSNLNVSKSDDHIIIDEDRSDYERVKRLRQDIVTKAKKFKGSKYISGGNGKNGFDCSGFTQYIYKQFEIKLARTSRAQSNQGKVKKIKDLDSGDLIFFGTNRNAINHVAIVVENTDSKLIIIHSSSSKGVVLEDIFTSNYWKKRLLFGKEVIHL